MSLFIATVHEEGYVASSLCVYVCVCVCERERESERECAFSIWASSWPVVIERIVKGTRYD